jgi:hypothetical protein
MGLEVEQSLCYLSMDQRRREIHVVMIDSTLILGQWLPREGVYGPGLHNKHSSHVDRISLIIRRTVQVVNSKISLVHRLVFNTLISWPFY